MKNLSMFLTLILFFTLFNCEKMLYVETGVLWHDDDYFNHEGDWYLALSEGPYSNSLGATIDVIDQLPIAVNDSRPKRFVLGSGSEGNITAFVYLDANGNGMYDDGYDKLTGYKFNLADASETTNIAVFAYY